MTIGGYVGKLLRVDLTTGTTTVEHLSQSFIETWVGGVGFGARILYEEVPAGVEWDDPENRMVWTAGPLGGSGVYGAGTFNVAAKGPMTGLAGASQANGFMGAYMKFSGFDGIVFTGRSPELVYLHIEDGAAELRDARHLAGKDLFELEDCLREELGVKGHQVSVYGIGPAGEQGVRFAAIGGDGGHLAAHNGLGAVMGAKNLKAVVAHRGKRNFPIHDGERLKAANLAMFEHAKGFGHVYQWGTGGGFSAVHDGGRLPVRNYTTSIFPEHERMNGQYMRTHFETRSMPCYKCAFAHVKEVAVTEGPYEGFVGEEPEYEQLAAWGPQIGNTDLGAVVMLTREVDRLGMDCNEASWTVGWVMECYEKGLLSKEDLDGLDLRWGNVEAVTGTARPHGCPRGYRGAAGGRGEASLRARRRRSCRPRRLHPQGRQPPQSRPSRWLGGALRHRAQQHEHDRVDVGRRTPAAGGPAPGRRPVLPRRGLAHQRPLQRHPAVR